MNSYFSNLGYQLKLEEYDNDLYVPDVVFLKKYGIKPSLIYETFWKFAAERQHIFEQRRANASYPWTNDSIMIKHKFTNAYRASDRVSQYLIKNIIYNCENSNLSEEDVIFRIILFKLFNKIETWEALENTVGQVDYKTFSFDKYDKILSQQISNGNKIYSAAYIMPSASSFGYTKKHQNNLALIELMMKNQIVHSVVKAKSLKDVYDLLLDYPSIGTFLAFQYAIDINYSELCDFSEMDFVVAGPGAKNGISKLINDKNGHSDEFIIRLMAENQELEFERLGLKFSYLGNRKLQLIDCQNLFCETDKYTRLAYPHFSGNSNRTRIKQKFIPNLTKPIQYFYPPKWKIEL